MSDSAILGVDFGTSHTVAVLAGTPLLFDGSPLLPSAVYAEPDGTLLVGRDAVHSARLRPERFEPNPKRRVDDGTVLLGDTEVTVVGLFAAVLSRVRSEAARVLGGPPARTVVTHPAVWGSARKLVLSDACAQAGLGPVELVPEPVAAARYFAARTGTVADGKAIVVYDFGGGTFDASVVAAGPAGFQVLAVDGLDDLGGVDIDHALTVHIGARFDGDERWTALANPADATARRHHRSFTDDVRTAKERLSDRQQVDVLVPILDVDTHLTREELERVTQPLMARAVRLTEAVMRAAAVPRERIAGVFLVGGASRMPLAATTLHRGTGIAPTVLDQPELVVATGATMAAPPPPPPAPPPPRRAPAGPPRRTPSRTAPAPRATAIKALHWVELAFMASLLFTAIITTAVEPPPNAFIWTVAIFFGMALPAIGGAAVAWNLTTIDRDPVKAGHAVTVTQSTLLGATSFCALVLVVMNMPDTPLVKLLPASLIVVSAVLLGLTRMARPPGLRPQWNGPEPLRFILTTQTAMLSLVALVAVWGWSDLLSYGAGVLFGPMILGFAVSVMALVMAIVSATRMNARRPMNASQHRALLACQSVWLGMALLDAIPWSYDGMHRFIPSGGGVEGRFPMSEDWLPGGSLDPLNDLALWLTVASAATAILAIVQLRRMPREALVPL